MRRKRSQDDDSGGGANWMDTYGDLVTLLLCFFVLLFSFSTIDAAKWQQLVKTFSGGSGVLENFTPVDPSDPSGVTDPVDAMPTTTRPTNETTEPRITPTPTPAPSPTPEPTPEPTAAPTTEATAPPTEPAPTPIPEYVVEMSNLSDRLSNVVGNSDLGAAVSLERSESSVRIRLIASVIFEPGTATLKPSAEQLLHSVAAEIQPYAPSVTSMHTEGHTSGEDIPEDSEINSDFKLASVRSAVVLDKLLYGYSSGVSPGLTYTQGYGREQSNPDLSPEQNDRVDIVISSNPN